MMFRKAAASLEASSRSKCGDLQHLAGHDPLATGFRALPVHGGGPCCALWIGKMSGDATVIGFQKTQHTI